MLDGLFNKKAAQAAANSTNVANVAPQRATVSSLTLQAGPAELAKESAIGADFQNVVDEAAIVFAGGEEKVAGDMLIDFLRQTNGQANRRVWFMLLDIYQAIDQQDQYEKLSLMFASRFGTSPPSWEEALGGSNKADLAAKAATMSGRNVLIVDGPAGAQIGQKSKDFIAASREMKSCKLDVSRMKMEQSTLEGISALQSIMGQLRKYKVAATLMGENHVATWLEKKIQASKEAANPNDTPYWMLSLEILQWRGLMESFEDQSLDYTITYEISGPGWEPSGVMSIETVLDDESSFTASDGSKMIQPDEIITDVSVQRLQESINLALAENGEARLDFGRVRRMAFSSAGTFLNVISLLGERGKRVVIVNPSELILALGDVVGFGQCVTLEERRR